MGNLPCMEYFVGERNNVYLSNGTQVQQILENRIAVYKRDVEKEEEAKKDLKFHHENQLHQNKYTWEFNPQAIAEKIKLYNQRVDLHTENISKYQTVMFKLITIKNKSNEAERYNSLNEIMIGVNEKYKDCDTDEFVKSLHMAESTWMKNATLQLDNIEQYTQPTELVNLFPVAPKDEEFESISII